MIENGVSAGRYICVSAQQPEVLSRGSVGVRCRLFTVVIAPNFFTSSWGGDGGGSGLHFILMCFGSERQSENGRINLLLLAREKGSENSTFSAGVFLFFRRTFRAKTMFSSLI